MAEQCDGDAWSRWLLHDRFGGDEYLRDHAMRFLAPIRDRVLDSAALRHDDVVLDVGSGDGLIGFGALDRLGPRGRVVFADVSRELLDVCERIAADRGDLKRCRFVHADASELAALGDNSVDVVTTRSVLCYVTDKDRALGAFARVLCPGGRVSAYEPINRRRAELNRETLFGYDATGVEDLAERLRQVYEQAQPPKDSPLTSFDETDLLLGAEAAGFVDIVVDLRLESRTAPPLGPLSWETFLEFRPNPHAPAVREAISEALDPPEAERLRAHLQPSVEAGRGARCRGAGAYLTARNPSDE